MRPQTLSDAPAASTDPRRHDLDALRAFAMLLGVAFHAALSFTGAPWIVVDTQSSPLFGLLAAAVHGFRMPLFFLVSGFFTALLLRRRGAQALVRHRVQRVLVPCLLGMCTIVPVLHLVSARSAARPAAPTGPPRSLVAAIRAHDPRAAARFLDDGADPNAPDPTLRITPLMWAALADDAATAEALIGKGAHVDGRIDNGSTALHAAAFLGHDAMVRLLLRRGADPVARSRDGRTPRDSAETDEETTRQIAHLLTLTLPSDAALHAGRRRCLSLLPAVPPQAPPPAPDDPLGLRRAYAAQILSPRLAIPGPGGGVPFHLIRTPVFEHLWFLWFLCWLLPFYLLWTRSPRRPHHAWPIALALLPQWFMGMDAPAFGPDTSVGLIPPPHLLAYYGCFFFAGAFYFDADDAAGWLGRRWRLDLVLALALLLPLGLATMGVRPLTGPVQVGYAWLMTTGLIGLFRHWLRWEVPWVRYLSDASYWIYIAHLPLVVAAQGWVRPWGAPAAVKFLAIVVGSIAVLLASYRILVRPTLLGVLLNGRRG